ncbi:NAD(P)-dependent dehydrogenase (short-subunit alcohol dehydrogenase family) [Bradyrhizobium diazoefficiens]
MAWINLSAKVAVVTGGGAGIGRGIALGLSAVGATVVVLDRDEAGAAVAAEISASGGRAEFLACDVTRDDSVARAAGEVAAKVGEATILVNNAGTMLPGGLDTTSMADWDRILSLNLTGYLRCARAFGEPMLARGAGAIVHVASISASFPQSYSGAYSVSKAGVAVLSRPARGRMGTARRTQQRRQPGHDPHADDRGHLSDPGRVRGAAGVGAGTAHRPPRGHRRCGSLPRERARELHHR